VIPMPVKTEETRGAPAIAGGRDPERRSKSGQKGSAGDVAFNAAVMIVVVAWAVLFFLAFSLRHHNV